MKKVAIIIAVILGAVFVTRGVYALTTSESDGWFGHMPYYNDTEDGTYYRGGCHGGYYDEDNDDYTYTWLYNHLSDEDRAAVDEEYARQLQAVDFTTMTLTEVQDTLDQIETTMAEYITENYDTTPWE